VIGRLLLWDVDGTLVWADDLGADVFDAALEMATGRRPTVEVRMSGKTDPEIVAEYLAAMGIQGRGLVDEVLRHSESLLAEHAAAGRLAADGAACPGVEDLLALLAEEPRVVSTLLTGNIEANAIVKVAAFGLERWFDPSVGAYGSDATDRNLLVPVALRRMAEQRGVALAPADAWVIGDTPRDLACARAGGARCLLVATGRYGVDELAALEPDAVLDDLRDGPAVVKLLTGDL